jgi:hypothetical protein
MANIKSSSEIAEKWSRVTPQRTEDYEKGVKSPTKDWAASTKAAEESYKQGVTKAAQEGRFGKGVSQAGTEKWQSKAATKGVDRWGAGVQVAKSDYEAGFAPYAEAIKSVSLPPRYPKGDPRNIERVATIAKTLRTKKVGK